MLCNTAIIALYALTRTVGIPLLGPEAGTVEAVAPIDLLSKALELLLVLVLWRTLAAETRRVGPGADA